MTCSDTQMEAMSAENLHEQIGRIEWTERKSMQWKKERKIALIEQYTQAILAKAAAENVELVECLKHWLMEHEAMLKQGELSACLWVTNKARKLIAKHTTTETEK